MGTNRAITIANGPRCSKNACASSRYRCLRMRAFGLNIEVPMPRPTQYPTWPPATAAMGMKTRSCQSAKLALTASSLRGRTRGEHARDEEQRITGQDREQHPGLDEHDHQQADQCPDTEIPEKLDRVHEVRHQHHGAHCRRPCGSVVVMAHQDTGATVMPSPCDPAAGLEILRWTAAPARGSPMPIATPEVYAEMLARAKEHSYAFPAINCVGSETSTPPSRASPMPAVTASSSSRPAAPSSPPAWA